MFYNAQTGKITSNYRSIIRISGTIVVRYHNNIRITILIKSVTIYILYPKDPGVRTSLFRLIFLSLFRALC